MSPSSAGGPASLDPPARGALRELGPDVATIAEGTVLWRVHATATAHALPWNRLRRFGPLATGRWDPHPEPAADHPREGVGYFAFDVTTCLAEVFQESRFIDVVAGAPYATAFALARDVRVLDLTGRWLLRAGARQSVATGPRHRTRRWARAIRAAWPDLDGLVAPSAVDGGRDCLVLWHPGRTALPSVPLSSEPLASPPIRPRIAVAADRIRYATNAAL